MYMYSNTLNLTFTVQKPPFSPSTKTQSPGPSPSLWTVDASLPAARCHSAAPAGTLWWCLCGAYPSEKD